MICRCDLIEFEGGLIQQHLGKVWDLGPVVCSKETGVPYLTVTFLKETIENSFVSLDDFKWAILQDVTIPFKIKFAIVNDQDEYKLTPVNFNDSAMFYYVETHFLKDRIELIFEFVAKGKELNIFNGFSDFINYAGNKKPLFWASLLKRDLHKFSDD